MHIKHWKFFVIALVMFTLGTTATAWAVPSIVWERSLGGPGDDSALAVFQTSDGGYVVGGNLSVARERRPWFFERIFWDDQRAFDRRRSFDNRNDVQTGWVVKLDYKGDVVWDVMLGYSNRNNYLTAMQQAQDGGVIVAGLSRIERRREGRASDPLLDLWLSKIDSEGNVVWHKILVESTHNRIFSIQQLESGDFVAVGYFGDDNRYGRRGNFWLLKLDPEGNIIWQKSFEVERGTMLNLPLFLLSVARTYFTYSIRQTADGGFIVAAVFLSQRTGSSSLVARLNFKGEIEWLRSLGGSGWDDVRDIYPTENGYIVVIASDSSDGDVLINHGGFDYWIVKLDLNGDIEWQRSFGGSGHDIPRSIVKTSGGYFIIAGSTGSNDGDISHRRGGFWIIKIDSNGNLIWEKSLSSYGTGVADSIYYTAEGGIIVAGGARSFFDSSNVFHNHGGTDFWIVKLILNE